MFHTHAAYPPQLDLTEAIDLNNAACAWIVGIQRRAPTVRAICGIPDVSDRLYALAVRFQEHMSRAVADNPARLLAEKYSNNDMAPVAVRKRSILARTIAPSLLDRLPDTGSTNVSERIKQYQLQCFQQHALSSYITIEAREKPERPPSTPPDPQHPAPTAAAVPAAETEPPQQQQRTARRQSAASTSVRPDHCLRVGDPLLRRQCLAWRCNYVGTQKACGKCNQPFNRTHVDRCGILSDVLANGQVTSAHAEDLRRYPHLVGSNYTTLDCILNHRELHDSVAQSALRGLNFDFGPQQTLLRVWLISEYLPHIWCMIKATILQGLLDFCMSKLTGKVVDGLLMEMD